MFLLNIRLKRWELLAKQLDQAIAGHGVLFNNLATAMAKGNQAPYFRLGACARLLSAELWLTKQDAEAAWKKDWTDRWSKHGQQQKSAQFEAECRATLLEEARAKCDRQIEQEKANSRRREAIEDTDAIAAPSLPSPAASSMGGCAPSNSIAPASSSEDRVLEELRDIISEDERSPESKRRCFESLWAPRAEEGTKEVDQTTPLGKEWLSVWNFLLEGPKGSSDQSFDDILARFGEMPGSAKVGIDF